MPLINKSEMHFQDEHIYYNINIYNGSDSTNNSIAYFSEERTEPILYNPEDYHLSVVRMEIPLSTIPIFYFPLIVGTNNPDNNFFRIFLRFNGVNYPNNNGQGITYITLNSTPGFIPSIYSYHHFVNLINVALSDAFNSIPGPILAILSAVPYNINTPPIMLYDQNTKLFKIIAQSISGLNGYNNGPINGPSTNTLEIWFNGNLFTYFEYFESFFRGFPSDLSTTIDSQRNFQIIVRNYGDNYVSNNLIITQEIQGLFLLNSLRKIILTTDSIPVKRENIATFTESGNPTTRSILSDFEPSIDINTNSRETVQYIPTAEYRLVDMLGNNPLRRLSIQIFWEDQRQKLYPIFIPPYKGITVKILFRKKSVIK